jgi:hypothetical protein
LTPELVPPPALAFGGDGEVVVVEDEWIDVETAESIVPCLDVGVGDGDGVRSDVDESEVGMEVVEEVLDGVFVVDVTVFRDGLLVVLCTLSSLVVEDEREVDWSSGDAEEEPQT